MSGVWHQYNELKQKAPGCLLLFRYGDFYELFGEDAEVAAPVLELVLTSREMGQNQRIAMAGIPHHALQSYLPRLLRAGFRIAIAEQVNSLGLAGADLPAPEAARSPSARGLMDRQIARVVTAGTATDPPLLDDQVSRYLASVVVATVRSSHAPSVGLAYADVSTGEFLTCQLEGPAALLDAERELARISPVELLLPRQEAGGAEVWRPEAPAECQVTMLDGWRFDAETATELLLRQQTVSSLDALGCQGMPLAARAAGALAGYVTDTLRYGGAALASLRTYRPDGHVFLDDNATRTLELFASGAARTHKGSLLWVLDQTTTPMGARLLRQWLSQPLVDLGGIHTRQGHIAELLRDPMLRARVEESLRAIGDLERRTNRAVQRQASPRDVLAIGRALTAVASLRALGQAQDDGAPLTSALLRGMNECADVRDLLDRAVSPDPPASFGDGVIRPGFSDELDELIASTAQSREWIGALEAAERERTGIRSLKVGYNRVFGYYLEITHANTPLVPPDYERRQTLVGAERYVTSEMRQHEQVLASAQERRIELETALFADVCGAIQGARDRLLATAAELARLDVFRALAEVAETNSYACPIVDDGPAIHILDGRHPVVEVTRRDEPFVPNHTELSTSDAQVLLLTGPNMAGKSTYLRQVALITILAQMGSFVPAREARIGVVDRIFTRIGAQDDIGSGRSTFLVEMTEAANLLGQSTPRSLLILDEIGRGTSTYDGLAIAQAVLEHIHNEPAARARTLFATHYHELTDLAETLPRLRNYRMAVSEEGGKVTFLRRVEPGAADRSYGIHVAKLAGMPAGVTRRAESILRELERSGRGASHPLRPARDSWQLSLFVEPDGIAEEIRGLDLLAMSPLEALTKLFELQRRARFEPEHRP